MNISPTGFAGLYLIEPHVFTDERGHFFESYNQDDFTKAHLHYNFIQDNQSKSTYGTIRGLHFQQGDYAQAKLVRVLEGEVLDVVVDLRQNSPKYGQYYSVELSSVNHMQLLIPRGFAHGFSVLSETATFAYKCDNVYHKESEGGVLYCDPALQINWRIPVQDIIISEKDANNPLFAHLSANFSL